MPALRTLFVRDDAATTANNTMNPTMLKLIIALAALILLGLALGLSLYLIRLLKRRNAKLAPEPTGFGNDNYRRLTIDIHQPAHVQAEKRALIQASDSPPQSPVPEIRITFPDEMDRNGKPRPQSGRVVVVRMGENNVYGLEPMNEPAPPYQPREGERFQSLDLNRMGGLKEKEYA